MNVQLKKINVSTRTLWTIFTFPVSTLVNDRHLFVCLLFFVVFLIDQLTRQYCYPTFQNEYKTIERD